MRTVGAYLFHAAALSVWVTSAAFSTVRAAAPGVVVAWGHNDNYQTSVPPNLGVVTGIAAGFSSTIALKPSGTIASWGNSVITANMPTDLTSVVAISAGTSFGLALKADGTVVAWGLFYDGQNSVPLVVPANLSGVVAISAGDSHAVALRNDGTVVAWGRNNYGQTNVPSGLSGAVAVAAGGAHSVAVKSDGTVVAWGANNLGQTSVPPGLSGVTAVTAGQLHSLALRSDGTIIAWGVSSGPYDQGQTTVPSGLNGVTAIAAGYGHSVALKNDGTIVAWGANEYGQISVPADSRGALAIAASRDHTVAIVGRPAITTQPANRAVNVTSNTTFAVAATGTAPLSYQWFGLTPQLSAATGTALVAGGFVFDAQVVSGGAGYVQAPAVRFVGGGGSGATATATVSNGAIVAITVVSPGSGYSSPPSLQIDPPNGFLAGQTNSVLTLNSVSTNDAGSYFVVITNLYGSATSSAATLTVNVPVTLTQQPQSIVTAFGSNAVFTVSASGTLPHSYQWFWQPGLSRTALAVPDVRNGFVVGAAVLYGGGFYSSAPAVQILAGAGSGATATATVNNGVVTAVNIGSPGSGYPSNTVIQIDPPVAGTTQLLTGRTATNLSLSSLGALASGNYFIVVTNAGGGVTSSPALLRVLVPQRFVQPPQRLGDGTFRLLFGAHDGGFLLTNDLASLEVWGSTNLANTNAWLRLTNGITVQNGQVQVDDADSPGLLRRFYRVLTR